MTGTEVIDAIKYMQEYQTETDKLEAKTAEKGCPQKCYDTISAFANKRGGIIIFGINEYNNFVEQDVYDVNDLQKQITSLCTTSLEPKIRPEFLAVTYNNKIHPTLAGMMVFGEYPQGYLPQLFIACVVVPGRKLGDVGELGQRFDDNERVEGTIEEMLDKSLAFVRRNIGTMVIIDDDGKRTDVPHYPMKALREAIANALIHRDYSTNTDGAYIYLRIFDDRIEILNPGDLYGNNRLENLGYDNMLEVRNNTIIRLLEDTTDIVENRHTGIATMRDEMKKMNLPEPEFENLRGTFKVTFRKEKKETTAQNITENCTDNFTENCTDNEIKLLGLLKINPNITQVELSNKLNVSRRTISTLLSHLKERGKIERVGSDRKGYWKILK